jgi:hypothetical protein
MILLSLFSFLRLYTIDNLHTYVTDQLMIARPVSHGCDTGIMLQE